MALVALSLFVVWFIGAFAVRLIIQKRSTGDSGLRAGALRAGAGSLEWWAGPRNSMSSRTRPATSLAELASTLSIASDRGMGRPVERVLRQTMIAMFCHRAKVRPPIESAQPPGLSQRPTVPAQTPSGVRGRLRRHRRRRPSARRRAAVHRVSPGAGMTPATAQVEWGGWSDDVRDDPFPAFAETRGHRRTLHDAFALLLRPWPSTGRARTGVWPLRLSLACPTGLACHATGEFVRGLGVDITGLVKLSGDLDAHTARDCIVGYNPFAGAPGHFVVTAGLLWM